MKQITIVFRTLLVLSIFSTGLLQSACSDSAADAKKKPLNTNDQDLAGILKRGKLVVLAENSSTSFFIYKGKKMGFEYEILREFAEDLGVELEVKIIDDLEMMTSQLNNNEGDILACNYAITKKPQQKIAFSIPFFQTNQVLIQRKPVSEDKTKDNFISDPIDLANKRVHVWKGSCYYSRLVNLQEEIGDTIHIRNTQGFQGVEELIELVADGQIEYTIAEKNIATLNEQFYENIDATVPISFNQNIGFGLRKNAPILKQRLDLWLTKFMQRETFAFIKKEHGKDYFDITLTLNPDLKTQMEDIFRQVATMRLKMEAYIDATKRIEACYFDGQEIVSREVWFGTKGQRVYQWLEQSHKEIFDDMMEYFHRIPQEKVTFEYPKPLDISEKTASIKEQSDDLIKKMISRAKKESHFTPLHFPN